jgi:hypothetical protein
MPPSQLDDLTEAKSKSDRHFGTWGTGVPSPADQVQTRFGAWYLGFRPFCLLVRRDDGPAVGRANELFRRIQRPIREQL